MIVGFAPEFRQEKYLNRLLARNQCKERKVGTGVLYLKQGVYSTGKRGENERKKHILFHLKPNMCIQMVCSKTPAFLCDGYLDVK
jgi:hypothetical protein